MKEKKEASYKKWNIDSDRIKKPMIKNFILLFLASDFAKPKKFSEIWKFVDDGKICTKITLCVYLDGLEKNGVIKKLKRKRKEKDKEIKRVLYDYALSNWDKLDGLKRDLIKRLGHECMHAIEGKEIDSLIKDIKKGKLGEDIVKGQILYQLSSLEKTQFELVVRFFEVLDTDMLAGYVTYPFVLRNLALVPYALMITLLLECYTNEKYLKVTKEAIDIFRKRKEKFCSDTFIS